MWSSIIYGGIIMDQTKKCTGCGEIKSINDDFHLKTKGKEARRSKCKTCYIEAKKKNRIKNKEAYTKYDKQHNKKCIERNRNIVVGYLNEHPCVDCGESNLVVLVFDHVNGDKRFTINHAVRKMVSVETLIKEIAKCEVRCANCHAIKTAREQNWWILKHVQE